MVCNKRYRCQNCSEVFSTHFESITSHNTIQNRFREFIYEKVLDTTILDISRKYKIAYSTFERTFYSVAREKADEQKELIEDSLSPLLPFLWNVSFASFPPTFAYPSPQVRYRIHNKCISLADAGLFVESFDYEGKKQGYCLYKVDRRPITYNAMCRNALEWRSQLFNR